MIPQQSSLLQLSVSTSGACKSLTYTLLLLPLLMPALSLPR
jgi:hypothetical protein